MGGETTCEMSVGRPDAPRSDCACPATVNATATATTNGLPDIGPPAWRACYGFVARVAQPGPYSWGEKTDSSADRASRYHASCMQSRTVSRKVSVEPEGADAFVRRAGGQGGYEA